MGYQKNKAEEKVAFCNLVLNIIKSYAMNYRLSNLPALPEDFTKFIVSSLQTPSSIIQEETEQLRQVRNRYIERLYIYINYTYRNNNSGQSIWRTPWTI